MKCTAMKGDYLIEVFGASWCSDTTIVTSFLDDNGIEYSWKDIEGFQGKNNLEKVLSTNEKEIGIRKKKIPVIFITSNQGQYILIEPAFNELKLALARLELVPG